MTRAEKALQTRSLEHIAEVKLQVVNALAEVETIQDMASRANTRLVAINKTLWFLSHVEKT